jgi:hypothetical protein
LNILFYNSSNIWIRNTFQLIWVIFSYFLKIFLKTFSTFGKNFHNFWPILSYFLNFFSLTYIFEKFIFQHLLQIYTFRGSYYQIEQHIIAYKQSKFNFKSNKEYITVTGFKSRLELLTWMQLKIVAMLSSSVYFEPNLNLTKTFHDHNMIILKSVL